MKIQNITGKLTEEKVIKSLKDSGLVAEKPVPDKGIDLDVYHPGNPVNKIKIQIKGRGENPQNGRWFQIRTSPKQRNDAVKLGLHVSETYKEKVKLCDFFILVSLKHDELWVFPIDVILEIIGINREYYKNRKDNQNGHQAEINLEITDSSGILLYKKYYFYRNNVSLIKENLKVT